MQQQISFLIIMSKEGQAGHRRQRLHLRLAMRQRMQGTDVEGKVVVAGSSSVTPVMEKLAEAYQSSE